MSVRIPARTDPLSESNKLILTNEGPQEQERAREVGKKNSFFKNEARKLLKTKDRCGEKSQDEPKTQRTGSRASRPFFPGGAAITTIRFASPHRRRSTASVCAIRRGLGYDGSRFSGRDGNAEAKECEGCESP